MKSLSKLGLGLSVIFTCLLLALVAEIYYLLWWKRRSITVKNVENDIRNSSKTSSYMFCCENQAISTVNISSRSQIHQEFHFHPENKPVDIQNVNSFREELLIGPPRFLYTIKEETKEEMESSEDTKITREMKRKCLNDYLVKRKSLNDYLTRNIDVTPFSSPIGSCHSSNSSANFGGYSYNPLYESSNNIEFNNIIKYSPPPKFKFLRNAEEKLMRQNMLMEQVKNENDCNNNNSNKNNNNHDDEGVNGSFITIIVAKNKDSDIQNNTSNHYHSPLCHYSSYPSSSSSSKVLPLAK